MCYDAADGRSTRLFRRALQSSGIWCSATPEDSPPLIDHIRESAYQALVLVLDRCGLDWQKRRCEELAEVRMTLKDQAPVQAFYYPEDSNAVAPELYPGIIEIDGPNDVPRLVQAIDGARA